MRTHGEELLVLHKLLRQEVNSKQGHSFFPKERLINLFVTWYAQNKGGVTQYVNIFKLPDGL